MTRKTLVNKLHAKLGHPVEDRMRVTIKHLHYNIKGIIDVCGYFTMEKIKQKSLYKVA